VHLPDIRRQSTPESWNVWQTHPGRNHHIVCAEHVCACLNGIATRNRSNTENPRFVPYREAILLYVLFEIGDKFVAAEKPIGVFSWHGSAFKLRLPVGAVQGKGVPSMVPPRIGCVRTLFEDDVILAFELQMITNGKTSLSASDDYGFKFPEMSHTVTSPLFSLFFRPGDAPLAWASFSKRRKPRPFCIEASTPLLPTQLRAFP
jgi:hypothetical protein